MVEEQITAALLAQAGGVYATAAGNRVFALVLPPGTPRPAITYQRISSDAVSSIKGTTSGLDRARIQIDCWAMEYGEVKLLAEQVRTVMQGAGFKALLDSDRDAYEEDTRQFRVSSDYFVWQVT